MELNHLTTQLSFLETELLDQLDLSEAIVQVPTDQEVVRPGQFIKVVPIVIDGLIKVSAQHEDKELLLYYIQPAQSCIMSFSAGINGKHSTISAVTEEDTTILLLDAVKLRGWVREYPSLHKLFFAEYDQRYRDILDTLNHLLFDTMDKKVLHYLKQRATVTGDTNIKLSHVQIARDLGTAREVVSRVMKKLEHTGSLSQNADGIKVL